jgi:hypothetical protein
MPAEPWNKEKEDGDHPGRIVFDTDLACAEIEKVSGRKAAWTLRLKLPSLGVEKTPRLLAKPELLN